MEYEKHQSNHGEAQCKAAPARASKFVKAIVENKNNLVVSFDDEKGVSSAIDRIINGLEGDVGYLSIDDFKVSNEIAEHLGIENDLALVMSKTKIRSVANEHFLEPEDFRKAIKEAAVNPFAIAFDIKRNSYQFSVEINRKGFRTVIEFGAIMRGMKDVKANVVTSVFREDRYKSRILRIKAKKIPGIFLIYEKGEGWAALATSSPTGVTFAVASATREDLSSSKQIIQADEIKKQSR